MKTSFELSKMYFLFESGKISTVVAEEMLKLKTHLKRDVRLAFFSKFIGEAEPIFRVDTMTEIIRRHLKGPGKISKLKKKYTKNYRLGKRCVV